MNNSKIFRHYLIDIHELTKSQKENFDVFKTENLKKICFNSTKNIKTKSKERETSKKKRKSNEQDKSIFIS